MKVAVLGAGSFGTALAQIFAKQADEVRLWTRDPTVSAHINEHSRHPRRFSQVLFAHNIKSSHDLAGSLAGARIVVSTLPMSALRETMAACLPLFEPDAIILSTTKGIEPDSLMFPHQILRQALLGVDESRLASLSGPNFASEIIRGLPWAAVIASKSQDTAKVVQALLSSPLVRVYYSSDVVGVELGGALKNVFAIAAGIVDGLELGCNARAALMTRALHEMSKFGLALGAEQKTIYGLSGLGDLLLSCTSSLSRNWRLGQGLALGKTLNEMQDEMGEVVEGVGTAKAASRLVQQFKLDAPICDAVNLVLFHGVPVKDAIMGVMNRKAGEE